MNWIVQTIQKKKTFHNAKTALRKEFIAMISMATTTKNAKNNNKDNEKTKYAVKESSENSESEN